jgi:hypothetical protein
MNLRAILRLIVLVLMAVLIQSIGRRETVAAQTQNGPFSNLKPNPQTGLLADPALPAGMEYQSAGYNSIFGQPCCIRPQGVAQGSNLGDCFFMSSVDALAMVTPGTIDNAIQYNSGSDTFTLKFFTPPAGQNAETTQPWVLHTYTTSAEVPFAGVLSRLWGATIALVKDGGGWTQAKDAYQQAMGANSADKALWPLLLEKGYAALQPNGYQSLGEGGNGMLVMHALTGAEGDQWLIPNPQPQRLEVTVKNMPAVSDLNGHCVLCGIFDGRGLTAIEPNIQVCLTIPGTQAKASSDYCTPVCKPGNAPLFFRAIRPQL